jgi:hypothetical protein
LNLFDLNLWMMLKVAMRCEIGGWPTNEAGVHGYETSTFPRWLVGSSLLTSIAVAPMIGQGGFVLPVCGPRLGRKLAVVMVRIVAL